MTDSELAVLQRLAARVPRQGSAWPQTEPDGLLRLSQHIERRERIAARAAVERHVAAELAAEQERRARPFLLRLVEWARG